MTNRNQTGEIALNLLFEALFEIEAAQPDPNNCTVHLEELFDRLLAKGWRPVLPHGLHYGAAI